MEFREPGGEGVERENAKFKRSHQKTCSSEISQYVLQIALSKVLMPLNRDKIYIMKADTVIVGSISEVPVSKNCAVRGCENDAKAQENMEENELAMHYPQQETESFPGSDVMIPVEEEGKEFHHPTTATEK
ncbi:runt-related transcription factor 3 [Platysternon megacephalum]|uniref:Runt-related transcription factor 3 n=1 Tax=Platysternon megacephalum TaxID=55544 RepID=A0A4D9EX82_9SAUR|nr:runt-related transcription factor 3 [Platysternon megacephalum]